MKHTGITKDLDLTLNHWNKNGTKCCHCGEGTEDSHSERRRFLHIVKYCEHFGGGRVATTIYKMASYDKTESEEEDDDDDVGENL